MSVSGHFYFDFGHTNYCMFVITFLLNFKTWPDLAKSRAKTTETKKPRQK